MEKKISRRKFIKTAAVTTGAGALGGAAFAAKMTPAAVQGPPTTLPTGPTGTADVVVVGGGFAGLTAAFRVRQAGRSVVLIEATERLGGRTFTARLNDRNRTPFEIGGAWVSGTDTQSNIKRLMAELNIGMFPQFTDGNAIFEVSSGEAHVWLKDDPPPLSEDALLNLGQALTKIGLMTESIRLNTPWEDVPFPPDVGPPSSVAADQITVQNWLDAEMADDDGKLVLQIGLGGVMAIDLNAVSLLQMLFLVRSFGSPDGLPPNPLNLFGTAPGQANAFRIPGGMGSITDIMIQRIGQSSIVTDSPVREIDQDESGATVISEQVTVRARKVIVALSTTLQGFIRFNPILASDRAQLQQRFPLGLVWKNWLVYDEAFWRTHIYRSNRKPFTGATTSAHTEDFYGATLDGGPEPNVRTPGLLVGFVDGDRGREYARLTRAERKQRFIDELAHRFDVIGLGPQIRRPSQRITFPVVLPQNPVPDNYFEFNWVVDEFGRGDYGGTPGPGVLTAVGFGPAIREPFMNVHWAGVDTSTECYGTINSAIQSGNNAARAVLARL